jgi:hypothetical protein
MSDVQQDAAVQHYTHKCLNCVATGNDSGQRRTGRTEPDNKAEHGTERPPDSPWAEW